MEREEIYRQAEINDSEFRILCQATTRSQVFDDCKKLVDNGLMYRLEGEFDWMCHLTEKGKKVCFDVWETYPKTSRRVDMSKRRMRFTF